PVALTEVHLGCTREEQLRWLLEAWHAAKACRAGGMDCRAITVWSILGAYDWNSLLTRADGYYESGVFDLSRGYSRPTAIAKLMPALAQGVEPDLPAVQGEGWWRRPIRFEYPAVAVPTIKINTPVPSREAGRPLLI